MANAILDRSRAINKFMGMGDFEDTYVTAIGNEESFGKNASKVSIFFGTSASDKDLPVQKKS